MKRKKKDWVVKVLVRVVFSSVPVKTEE